MHYISPPFGVCCLCEKTIYVEGSCINPELSTEEIETFYFCPDCARGFSGSILIYCENCGMMILTDKKTFDFEALKSVINSEDGIEYIVTSECDDCAIEDNQDISNEDELLPSFKWSQN